MSSDLEPVPNWNFESPHGKLITDFSAFTQPIEGLPTYQNRLEGQLSEAASWGDNLNAKVIPWVRVWMPDTIGGLNRQARPYFDLKEAWIQYSRPSWDLTVGNQIFSWGAADVVNPTDSFNPLDFTDPFQTEKLPLLAAKLGIHPAFTDRVSLEVIGTPYFRESKLPVQFPDSGSTALSLNDSRWLLPLPSTIESGGNTFPLSYVMTPATYPDTWQLGARLKLNRIFDWDFSLYAYNGVEKTPRIYVAKQGTASDPNLPITLTLNPSFHRETMFGVDGEGAVPGTDVGVRFEAAYRIRDNSRTEGLPPEVANDLTKDNYFHGVVGFDYTFPHNVLWTVMYTNLMYVLYQRIGPEQKSTGQDVISNLPTADPWDRNVVAYVENRITSDYKITQSLLFSHEKHDGLYSPAIQGQINDSLNVSLGGDLFFGPSTEFFGQFSDNRRLKLIATYTF